MSAPQPVRALQIIDTLGMGGAETWLMEVLRLWSRSGEGRMDFLATSGNSGIFDDEARRLGANIHYVRYRRAELGRFAPHFRQILRQGGYDAIHDHQDYSSGWHFLMGAGRLPPIRVTHVHNAAYQILNNYGVTFGRRLTQRIGKSLIARFTTHIVGTSRQVVSDYGFDAPQFAPIPKAALHCGFDPARFLANAPGMRESVRKEFLWPDDARIALCAGRIDQSPEYGHAQNNKNSRFSVDVGIACARRDPRVHMLFAGASSPAVPVLEKRIAEAGLTGRLRFLGVRRDIERLMTASDVLFFPSRGEGLGMVAVEAQAAGVPVLASTAVPRDCAVVPEMVRFEDLDAPEGRWADALLDLMARRFDADAANRAVAASAFAIANSAAALSRLYRSGRLG